MVPIFLTYTRKILDFSDLGTGTADYIAKMWYFRIYFPLQMWFFSDSGMVWYVWDMWYTIMRCILKGFDHASNGSAENWSWSFTPSFTLEAEKSDKPIKKTGKSWPLHVGVTSQIFDSLV